jgi:RNA polymerase sigma factor (sigma-70 family)
MTNDPDISKIDRVIAGDRQAYAELVDKHKSYAYTIAYKILQNRPEAEEAAQDSFIKAFHNLAGFNRQSKFSTWLYRIVFNTAITYKRKSRHQFESIDQSSSIHSPEGDSTLEKDDKKKYLDAALSRLNEADRTALTLFYLDEFSLEEIAEIMSMQANTIKVRVHRARQRLADELKAILNHEALTL